MKFIKNLESIKKYVGVKTLKFKIKKSIAALEKKKKMYTQF